ILPPRLALFKREKAKYIDDGHTQLLHLLGSSLNLSNYIYHDDRKPLSRWLWAQDRYMKLETEKLLKTPPENLSLGDKIRKVKVLAPLIVPIYCLFLKKGILDGWHGWYYALQRTLAEILLSIHLIEAEKLK
ncbi:MAG: glycosyltransferase family 2 protein, partial [Microcystaceae cyanobacterium]